MQLDRIAEASATSRTDGVSVEWRYFDSFTRRSDEAEMKNMMRLRALRLEHSLEGHAAHLVLNIHRIPSDRGVDGPPGFGFERRHASAPTEVDVPVGILIAAAAEHLGAVDGDS